jgi:putative transcriptional regulator
MSPGEQIRAVRALLKLSQPQFAREFGLSVGTLRQWEQDRKYPEGPAMALIRAIVREPETMRRLLA